MKLQDLQRDPAKFRDALLIDSDSGPVRFSTVIDEWQAQDFAALDPGWRATVTQSSDDALSRAWLERPRGHSKTLDLAVMSTWALFASKRRLSGIAAAADLDQARLLRDAISKLIYLNPWLQSIIEVQNTRILNVHTESCLEFISSDVGSSYGLTPDFVICDEATHWRKRDLWDSLISSAAKRSRCMFVTITNAGVMDDWQWNTREAIRTDSRWHFSRLEGPVASWMSPTILDEQRRLLPPTAFARLWLNEWASGGGDALSADDIEAAFKPNLEPIPTAKPGWVYVAGLDLGVSRDASALVVLGIRRGSRRDSTDHGRIRLCHVELWRPTKKSKVNLQSIEDRLVILHQRYKFKAIANDPWESRHMSQRLALAGLPMQEVTQQGANLQRIASTIIESFADRRVDLFEQPDLHRDLRRLRVEERQYGFRLTSPKDGTGHGDAASAFGFAMLAATDAAARTQVIAGGQTFTPRTAYDVAVERLRKNAEHEARVAAAGYEDQGELPFILSALRDPRLQF